MTKLTRRKFLRGLGVVALARWLPRLPGSIETVKVKHWLHPTQERIDEFAELLQSQNIAHLDYFNISAGKVRARCEELLVQGLDRQSAWVQAVMEMSNG